jgi:hypothetical protein
MFDPPVKAILAKLLAHLESPGLDPEERSAELLALTDEEFWRRLAPHAEALVPAAKSALSFAKNVKCILDA